jgi:hypothetical protein
MNAGIATLVFLAIMAVGVTVWAVSLRRALRLGRPARSSEADFFVDDRPSSEFEWQSGRITLRGNREMVSKAVVRSLLQVHFGMLASVFKIQQYEDGRVVLKKVGPLLCNLPPGLYFTEAEIAFQDLPPGTVEVSYRLGYGRLVRLLRSIALALILGIGLPVLILVACAISLLVISCPIEGIRWQVFQTLQIIHALWPPFLVMWFYSLGKRRSKILIENMIASSEILQ